ncbi:MAG TPA: isocitrate lyase/PEP mutase family protein [Candidatus Eisenbacteria bacterium]|nr:isocitrate lyase/PEP mutase family protein [Candidatus Eisenbacteria bacterium]
MNRITALLAGDGPLVIPGVYDALSAKLAAEAGFRAVLVSGYCLSATRLGEPDFGLITQTEVLDAAARIVAAVDIPVLVDIDTGYGNAFNVERTVKELVRLGAAGCFLEDQVWPKRCGHMDGKRVVPLDEYLPKLAAARETGGPDFWITARTDARAVTGLDDAIARGRAFAQHGASAVFVEAPESEDEMARVRTAIPPDVPLVANMVEQGKTPIRSAAELAAAGHRLVLVPVAPLLASTHALRALFATLARDGRTAAMADRMTTFGELNALVGLGERYRRERDWLR